MRRSRGRLPLWLVLLGASVGAAFAYRARQLAIHPDPASRLG